MDFWSAVQLAAVVISVVLLALTSLPFTLAQWLLDHIIVNGAPGAATIVTAAATVGTVIVAALAVRQSREAVRAARDAADAAREQARLSEQAVSAARETVDAARQQAELSREALESSIRPMLVDVPDRMLQGESGRIIFPDGERVHVKGSPDGVHFSYEHLGFIRCSVSLRNIGRGPAVIQGLGLEFGDGSVGWSGAMNPAIVAPDEITRLTFSVPTNRPELAQGLDELRQGRMTVVVGYSDGAGRQNLLTRAFVAPRKNITGTERVRQVFVYRRPETEPFASSGPAGD